MAGGDGGYKTRPWEVSHATRDRRGGHLSETRTKSGPRWWRIHGRRIDRREGARILAVALAEAGDCSETEA